MASEAWQSILDGSRNVRFADLGRLLVAFGFVLDRQSGSHRIWRHPASRARMNVQPMRGKAKPYQLRQLVEIVESEGLRINDE